MRLLIAYINSFIIIANNSSSSSNNWRMGGLSCFHFARRRSRCARNTGAVPGGDFAPVICSNWCAGPPAFLSWHHSGGTACVHADFAYLNCRPGSSEGGRFRPDGTLVSVLQPEAADPAGFRGRFGDPGRDYAGATHSSLHLVVHAEHLKWPRKRSSSHEAALLTVKYN